MEESSHPQCAGCNSYLDVRADEMKTNTQRAWSYAKRREPKHPKEWETPGDKGFRGEYWWGLYDGYLAGLRAGKRLRTERIKKDE